MFAIRYVLIFWVTAATYVSALPIALTVEIDGRVLSTLAGLQPTYSTTAPVPQPTFDTTSPLPT